MKFSKIKKFIVLLTLISVFFVCKGKNKTIQTFAEEYKQQFEKEASSVQINVQSPKKAEILSSYQGARMNSYTSLFLFEDSKSNQFLVSYTYQCSFENECEMDFTNLKAYDSNWKEITTQILPTAKLQAEMNQTKQTRQLQNFGMLLDILPNQEGKTILQFSLAELETFSPEKGSVSFAFGYCEWITEKGTYEFTSDFNQDVIGPETH